VFPSGFSVGCEVLRRDPRASGPSSSPPQQGCLEAAHGLPKVVFLAPPYAVVVPLVFASFLLLLQSSGESGGFLRSALCKDVEAPPGRIPLSAGDAQASTCSFLIVEFHMKVVKSVKMKPPEVALLELLSFHTVHGSPCRDALSSCRSPRKSEWCHPQLACQRACHASLRLGLSPLYVGRSKGRE
jgi:hypothetical protein